MLCSVCNNKPAILFIDKVENGKSQIEGLCYDCAKKKGIDPTEALKRQAESLAQNGNLENMTKQFEEIFQDLSQNINPEEIEGFEQALNEDIDMDQFDEENGPKIFGSNSTWFNFFKYVRCQKQS